jgi:small subunit ribosomal protein S8
MSMSDPIGDMLVRISNAQRATHRMVEMPSSKVKKAIAKVLKAEGYISDFAEVSQNGLQNLKIELKYFQGKPVIESIKRVSRPGLRVYKGKEELPKVMGGLGIAIVSTSRGIMTDSQARGAGVGGEVICTVA